MFRWKYTKTTKMAKVEWLTIQVLGFITNKEHQLSHLVHCSWGMATYGSVTLRIHK